MTKLEKLENEVKLLAADELAVFREWFLEYDWAKWDQEIEADAAAGRLDGMVKEAMNHFTSS
jgi:hypothetical protein